MLAALQSSGVTDGSLELPDGIVLPAKSLQDLLDIEKLLENGEILRKMVCACHINLMYSLKDISRAFVNVYRCLSCREVGGLTPTSCD